MKGGTLYWVSADHLGRPEIVTNAAKQVVWRAANRAFDRGVVLDQIGGYHLGFPGQYHDAESGLWHNGFRDYEPTLGRYIQSDPIGLAGGISTYGYVRGNPVGSVDPLGLVDRKYVVPWDSENIRLGLDFINSPSGMLTVGVHFNGGNFIGPNGENWTPEQLAQRIRDDTPNLSSYSSVRLYSCRSGAPADDGAVPAQRVANALGLPVQAPTLFVWIQNNPERPYVGNFGKMPDGSMDRSNRGVWHNFYPGGP